MSFINIPNISQEHKDIILVGDYADKTSIGIGKQFGVAIEGVIEQALHMANLGKRDIRLMNLFPNRIHTNGMWVDNSKPSKRYFTPDGKGIVAEMKQRLAALAPKVVMPMGPCAVQAFLDRTDYTDIRGYPFQQDSYLVIPTLHPRDMIWSNYIWRFYFSHDLQKAKDFALGKIRVINPDLIILDSYEFAKEVLANIEQSATKVSLDIEVSNYEVSCIGFSVDEHTAYSLPFDNRWTLEEETYLWEICARIIGNPNITKVGQNFIFDLYFLCYRMGIIPRGAIIDTMMGSSIAFPDFLKGLGFLGSIHTTYTYWKDQMDFKNIKEES